MTSTAVRLGLVGCGRLAERGYLPAIAGSRAVRLVAVADRDAARRAAFAATSSALGIEVEACADVASLLERAAPDAVVLATPVEAHVEDATVAAARGVRVLVEKPPAADARGAAALADLTPTPFVSFNRRFEPGVADVRAAVPPDGDVALDLEITYRRRNWSPYTVHDDALLDLGPHLVDWARWLTGSDAIAVRAATVQFDRAWFTMLLERGRATIRASTNRIHREVVQVHDRRGRRLARHVTGGFVAAVRGRTAPASHPLVHALGLELDAFARAVRGEPCGQLATASDGVAVMNVIDAVRVSAGRHGRSVALRPAARA